MKIKFLSFALLVLLLACENQYDVEPSRDSGYLYLESSEEYESLAAKARSFSDEELAAYERDKGYVSYRSALVAVNNALDAAQTEAEFDAIMKSNTHLVKLVDDMVRPVIDNAVYQVLANEDGYFEAGEKSFKVAPEFLYSTQRGDKELLETIPLADSVHHKNITSVRYSTAAAYPACVTALSQDYFENHGGCNNDKRVYLYLTSLRLCGSSPFDPPLNYCSFEVWIRVENFKRQAITCKWVNDNATLTSQNVVMNVGGYQINATTLVRSYWFLEQTHQLTILPNAPPYTNKPFPIGTAYGEGLSSDVNGVAVINFTAPPGICI